ncbi:putative diguanylate cyclase YcdT [compost metagenome]
MRFSELIFSELAPVISYLMISVMLAMMLVVSIRLFLNRRKKGYLTMTLSLIILITHYILLVYFTSSGINSTLSTYLIVMLRVMSFILVNMGVYQLYNPTRAKQYMFIYSLILIGLFISLLHFYIPVLYQGPAEQIRLLQDIGTDLYLFILILVCFYVVSPYIGQQYKYNLGLVLFFFNHVAYVINTYIYAGIQPYLTLFTYIAPIAFYFMLFLILFDRVVELMQAIYHSSITDGLTGLFNRKYFFNRVHQYVVRQLQVYVLFSDIDNFKKLNDTKGHQMGDVVLKQVAQIMKEEAEEFGVAGRYGGEEMVLLITDPDVKMEALAEKVRARIETETIVTVSIGYSKFKNGVNAEQLIKQADEAMYKAKTTGKNKVVKYTK